MGDDALDVAVERGDFGKDVGEVGQAGQPALGDAVRGLVVRDDAIAGLQEWKDERAHLRRIAAPAVSEHHGGRFARAPAPHRDMATLVLEKA
jgi:hypothetical protein